MRCLRRITNRESARRMRLKRQEEWAAIKRQVFNPLHVSTKAPTQQCAHAPTTMRCGLCTCLQLQDDPCHACHE